MASHRCSLKQNLSDYVLFLGFKVTPSYSEALQKMERYKKELFISKNSASYLSEMVIENQTYLGKLTGSLTSLSDLELLEKNIYSILSKFIPDYSYEDKTLFLFPVPATL